MSEPPSPPRPLDKPEAPGAAVGDTQLTGPYTPPSLGSAATPPDTPAPGPASGGLAAHPRIGRYEVFAAIGHGGMGAVLRGRDPDLGRELAIKVLLEAHQDRPEMVRRFVEEARVGGRLQHPGVVPIYELGQAPAAEGGQARPYFTMKLIEGRTLAVLLAERGDPARDLPRFLKVFEQVCQTLGYAHAHGVLHRDLKPANIMVGAFGEVQVMDWGLAKVLGRASAAAPGPAAAALDPADSPLTHAGAIMGTPAYMPPEQARGEPLDERADVFSLGAILCEVLTGRPPCTRTDGRNILEQAQRGDLTEAFTRLDACGADADLVRLARDCLAPQAADRPRHAGVVAERMTVYRAAVQERLRAAEMDRAAAQARAEEARAKATAERKARRLTITLAALIVLTALGGAAGGLWLENDRANRAAEQFAREAEEARKESATVQAISLTLEQAREDLDRNQHPAALAMARRAEGLLASGGEALRPRVEEMLADLDMFARLSQIRLETIELSRDQSGFDPSRLMPRYQQDFDRYGIPVLNLEISAAAERIRRRAIRPALLTALDHWAVFAPKAATRKRLLAIAQAADPNPQGVMAALRQAMIDEDARAFRQKLFSGESVKHLPPPMLVNLASSLAVHGDAVRSVQLLQSGLAIHPDDFWLHYQLGFSLMRLKPPRVEEAIRHDTAAVALRPDVPSVWVNLGGALAQQGRLAESINAFNKALALEPDLAPAHYSLGVARLRGGEAAKARASFEEAIRLQPGFAPAHYALGGLLARQRSLAEAERHLREAIRLKPNYADAHNDLANVLSMRGRRDDAITAYRTALKHAPDDAKVWKNLGEAQGQQGRLEEAAESFEKALRLAPNFAEAHNDLGFIRLEQKRPKEAVAALRQAVALQPNDLKANANLANALRLQGRLTEAIPVYRKVIELHPSPDTQYNLGNALLESGELSEAKAACEKALQLKPEYAEARVTLGLVLLYQGQFEGAKKDLTAGLDLLDRRHPHRAQVQAALDNCDRMIRVTAKLPAILKGEAKPADNGERILLASYCMQVKHHYASAARLLAEGFSADSKLAANLQSGLRYQAARAAIQAAAGRGEDAATLDDKARLRWRKQALEWLRADLDLWSKQVDKGPAAARAQARATLGSWRNEPHLAPVREAAEQVWLPKDERRAWRKLWADVDRLCMKAGP